MRQPNPTPNTSPLHETAQSNMSDWRWIYLISDSDSTFLYEIILIALATENILITQYTTGEYNLKVFVAMQ